MPLRILAVLVVCTALTAAEDAQSGSVKVSQPGRIRLAGIAVGAGYSHYSGYPGYRPWQFDPFYYGLYDSYFPGFFTGFNRGPNMGEIRLHSSSPKAEVYLNGAYAGEAGQLKGFWLEPGAYNLEVRSGSQITFSRRVYVLTGKTLKIATESKP